MVLRRLLTPAGFREQYDYLRGRYADAPTMLDDLNYKFEDLAGANQPSETPA